MQKEKPLPGYVLPAEVKNAIEAVPAPERKVLLRLRSLILDTWTATGIDAPLIETLKWGQPAYLPGRKGIGTTLRLGVAKTGEAALFVHCQTTLIDELHEMFPGTFRTVGNRSVLFRADEGVQDDKLGQFMLRALTYHRKLPR